MMKYTVLILSLFFSVAGFGQGQMFLRATPAAAGNLLLDDYPGATVAYATVKLRAAADSCMVIRRDSDNTTALIGFSGNNIDNAAINSHCSGTNCFVVRWSDQTGGGNDAVQTTTANQPKIYDSVTGITTLGTNPALKFDGSNDHLVLNSAIGTGISYLSYFHLEKKRTNASVGFWLATDSGQEPYVLIHFSDDKFYASPSGSFFTGPSSNTNDYNTLSMFTDQATSIAVYRNGVSVGSFTRLNVASGTYKWIGRRNINYTDSDGQLLIFYPSDQSANRTAIETIINNYYSIY